MHKRAATISYTSTCMGVIQMALAPSVNLTDPRASAAELRRVVPPIRSGSAELPEFTQRLSRLSGRVDSDWDHFPVDVKDAFRMTVYTIITPPKGLASLTHSLQFRIRLARAALSGELDQTVEYFNALQAFIDSVLDRVERDNLDLQAKIGEAAMTAVEAHHASGGTALTPEEFSERFNAIPARK